MNKQPRVSLLVLNYNGKKLLTEYLNSVLRQTYAPSEILLIDNGSTDGSINLVRGKYPEVKIVENGLNLGTAEGSNVGFHQANGNYIIFQNNDIRNDRECFQFLINILQRDEKIGICTSVAVKYLSKSNKKNAVIESVGAELDRYGFNWPIHHGKKLIDIPIMKEVFGSYGNSFIIRREILDELSGFDSKFFTLNDDIDLSWRVRLLGYKIVYNRGAIIYHKGHATLGPLFARRIKRYWSERNVLRTLLKNYSLVSLMKYLPIYFLLLICEFFYHLMTLKPGLAFAVVKAVLWNVLYLPDTIRERIKVQRMRRVSDREITKHMYHSSFKLRFINIK